MKRRPKVIPAARYTVDAAAKALELLSVFSFREPRLSLADLATRTGIPRATAFRLLSTLEQSGFLDKVHGAYQLGIKCFVLGNIVAGGLDLRETARPHLAALREATRETTQIAILDHWQVVYLERMLSPLSVGYMRSRAGAILPAYCTGLGKTLLAFRPEAEVQAWAATQKFAALTPRTITSAKRLLKELAVDPRARLRPRRGRAREGRQLHRGADLQPHRRRRRRHQRGRTDRAHAARARRQRDRGGRRRRRTRNFRRSGGSGASRIRRVVPRRVDGAWRTKVKRVVLGLVVARVSCFPLRSRRKP